MKILLVEDHAALAQISCNQLREIHGHDVVHVTTGQGVLAAMDGFRPDLVLLDLNLPDMTGYDVAVRIREHPQWDAVVLVALTAFGNETDPLQGAISGIDAHFRKPMDFAGLPHLRRRTA